MNIQSEQDLLDELNKDKDIHAHWLDVLKLTAIQLKNKGTDPFDNKFIRKKFKANGLFLIKTSTNERIYPK